MKNHTLFLILISLVLFTHAQDGQDGFLSFDPSTLNLDPASTDSQGSADTAGNTDAGADQGATVDLSSILAAAEPASEPIPTDNGDAAAGTGDIAADTPIADTPVADILVADTPVADTPVADTPVADTPVADTAAVVDNGDVAAVENGDAPAATDDAGLAGFDFGSLIFGDGTNADQPAQGTDTAPLADVNDSETVVDVETETAALPFDFGDFNFGDDTTNTDQLAEVDDTTEPADNQEGIESETVIDSENLGFDFGDLGGDIPTDQNADATTDVNTEDAANVDTPIDEPIGAEPIEDETATTPVETNQPEEAATEPVVTDLVTIDFANLAIGGDEVAAGDEPAAGTGDEVPADAAETPADSGETPADSGETPADATIEDVAAVDNTEGTATDVPPGDEAVDTTNVVDTGLLDIDFGDLIGGTDTPTDTGDATSTETPATDATSTETPATDATATDATTTEDAATEPSGEDVAATPASNDATDAGLINIDFGSLIAPTEEPTESVETPLFASLNDVIFGSVQPTITETDAQTPVVDQLPIENEDTEPFIIDLSGPIFGEDVVPDATTAITDTENASTSDQTATDISTVLPNETATSDPLIDLNAPDTIDAVDATTGINETGVPVQNDVKTIQNDFGSFFFDLPIDLNTDDTEDAATTDTVAADTQDGQDTGSIATSDVPDPTTVDASGNPYTIQCDFSTGEFACRTCYYVAGCTGDNCAIDYCQ